MDMPSAFRREEHLHSHHDQDGHHGDEASHGWVTFVPERRETWVCERDECCWEKVHKCGRDENACAEVARQKEEVVGHWEAWEAADDYGEGTCKSAKDEYEEQRRNMEGCVVVRAA